MYEEVCFFMHTCFNRNKGGGGKKRRIYLRKFPVFFAILECEQMSGSLQRESDPHFADGLQQSLSKVQPKSLNVKPG